MKKNGWKFHLHLHFAIPYKCDAGFNRKYELSLMHPLAKGGSRLLADDNTRIESRNVHVDSDLYFFKRPKTPDVINIYYVLTIGPEKYKWIQLFFQLSECIPGQILFTGLVNNKNNFTLRVKENDVLKSQ